MVNCCASFGILFTWAAVILLIFGNIGQLNDTTIPRHLRIVSLSTSGLSKALSEASGSSNFTSIYYSGNGDYFTKGVNESRHDGLRKTYEWGLWGYCATNGGVGDARSYCEESTINPSFQPAKVLLEDVPTDFADALKETLPDNVFTADDYLGTYTQAASYVILLGSLSTALAALFALFARRLAFILAAIFSLVGFLGLAVGLIVYTVVFNRVIDAINDATVSGVNVGIDVAYGYELWILWAACVCMLFAVPPTALACCCGRTDKR
ncbi:hypothetical protein JCM10212_006379 [Sporobolomyces blumeae]